MRIASPRTVRFLSTLTADTPQFDSAKSFALYNTSAPPTPAQLSYATKLLVPSERPKRARLLATAPQFKLLPESNLPEVAFLGRSNCGKSSTLNALLGFDETAGKRGDGAHVSKTPGYTETMNAFGVGDVIKSHTGSNGQFEKWTVGSRGPDQGALVVMDMPGYGRGSIASWGAQIQKYLRLRKQLRRVFILIDAMHGAKDLDLEVLAMLAKYMVPHQIVLSKIDTVLFPKPGALRKVKRGLKLDRLEALETMQERVCEAVLESQRKANSNRIQAGTEALKDILGVSAEVKLPSSPGHSLGIDGLRWAVLEATGLSSNVHGTRKSLDVDVVSH